MKKKITTANKLSLLAILVILFVSLSSHPTSADSVVIIAPTFPEPDFSVSDNVVSDSWNQITTFANLSEFGSGGFAKFSHNETHIYALLATSDEPWIAIEFDASPDGICMMPNHDTWVFYIDASAKTINPIDATFKGTVAKPESDSQNDIVAEAIFTEDVTYIEVTRKFDTQDQSSPDMLFANGTETYLTFASEGDHTSTRNLYYLNIQFTDVDSIIQVKAPDVTDWTTIKEYVIFGAVLFAVLFALTHYIIRQKLRPLDHGSRIIDSTILRPPKFKERWNTLIHGVKTVNIMQDLEGEDQ